MTDTDKFNNIYLSLEIRKSEGKTDAYGNYIFEVEASNENLDLQNQIVLQNALMESKDEFLKGGVISYDHLHKRRDEEGNVISDPSMVIGEPIDVIFDKDSKKTIVKGKLYSTNEKAREIINMLKAGSTRVRASVGGIFPQVVKNVKTGIEKITHVFWNDLALTTSPVNNTVGSAVFAKSMTSAEFVDALPIELKKSLCAGYGTDSNEMTGGRALIPEDTKTKTVDVAEKSNAKDEKTVIAELVELLKKGRVDGEKDAIDFLVANGIDKAKAGEITSEIINQGGQMMKKSFSKTVSDLMKSLTGGNPKDGDEDINKGGEGNDTDLENDEDEIDLDGSADENKDEEDENEDNNDGDSEDEDGDMVEGGEVLKALDSDLSAMRKSIKDTNRRLDDLGEAVVGIATMLAKIGNQELPPKSVLSKSMNSNNAGTNAGAVQNGRPTEDDLYNAQIVLARCVKEGKIDMVKSSMISSDMQKCMATGRPMRQDYFEFLQKELAKGVN